MGLQFIVTAGTGGTDFRSVWNSLLHHMLYLCYFLTGAAGLYEVKLLGGRRTSDIMPETHSLLSKWWGWPKACPNAFCCSSSLTSTFWPALTPEAGASPRHAWTVVDWADPWWSCCTCPRACFLPLEKFSHCCCPTVCASVLGEADPWRFPKEKELFPHDFHSWQAPCCLSRAVCVLSLPVLLEHSEVGLIYSSVNQKDVGRITDLIAQWFCHALAMQETKGSLWPKKASLLTGWEAVLAT